METEQTIAAATSTGILGIATNNKKKNKVIATPNFWW